MFSLAKLHAAATHFPIALLLVGSAAALLYLFRPSFRWRTEVRTYALWSLVLGWIGTAIAIVTGLLAQSGLPPDAPYRALLNWHIGTGLALLVLYGGVLYAHWLRRPGRTLSRKSRQRPPLLDDEAARRWLSIALIVGIALVVASGWNGGRLVYEWGVNVAARAVGG